MKKFLGLIDFGNEAGDDTSYEELTRYFYRQPGFNRYCDSSKRLEVATAKKGVGKSALLRWVDGGIREKLPNDIVISCRGADLVRSRFGMPSASGLPNESIRDWMIRICALINRAIARRINFAMSDDSITMVESAELEGFKERNLVGCLLDRFGRMLKGKGPEKKRVLEELELLKRNDTKRVWILIDDLDATFQNTTAELLELSTFFSALRYLTQDVGGAIFRVTLRADVWPLIRRYDESLDKLEQYVTEIVWTKTDFKGIIEKRIQSQVEVIREKYGNDAIPAISANKDKYMDLVFERQMNWSDKMVPSHQVLYTVAYQRPRWGIQLCKLSQREAIKTDSIIHKTHIDRIWGEYGTKRIADLVAEHKHQCRDVEDLILCFRGAQRLFKRDELFDWINRRVIPHVNTQIEGRTISSSREIAQFLYRMGFIVARSDGEDGYEHYMFDQMPDFLTSRTDQDFNVLWEIHPCYREALDITKVDKSHKARFGEMRR